MSRMILSPVLGLVFLLTALTGCTQQQDEGGLRFGLAAMPSTLDPRFATDAASVRINRLLYRQLVDFDASFEPVPDLARWEALSPRHYRFTLVDDGRVFHDGSRLTARDVAATYRSVLDPDVGSPHRAGIAGVASVVALDDKTVDFHLSRADPLFPGRLVIGILPAALIAEGHPFRDAPVGSGTLAFRAWPSEGRLRLVRPSDSQVFEFLHVPDPTVRVLKLVRGEIDMLQGHLPPELVRWLEGRGEVQVQRGRGTDFAYMGFNLEDPVVGMLPVRRAIAHAINRVEIIEYVLGRAAREANALLTPAHWAGAQGLVGYAHDPERARALLRDAGFHEGRPARIVYKTSSDALRLRLATIIQQQLGRVGVQVQISSYDWGTFYGDIRAGRFQMYSMKWVGIKMPDIFRYVFHSRSIPPAGANRGRYVSEVVDRLIDRAEASDDLRERSELYRGVQRRLLDDLPYVPLWYEDQVFVARRSVLGYSVKADGSYDGLIHVRRGGGA